MATTPRGYPYPALTDAPNGPTQIQALATAVDTDVGALPSVASGFVAMPAPSALNSPVSQAVTFPTGRFTVNPIVTCTVLGTTPQTFAAAPTATPLTTGFTLTMVQSSGTLIARTVHWIAVEPV